MLSRHYFQLFLKLFVYSFLFFICCAIETSFWPFIFGSFPAPQLWLVLIVYLILKWPLYLGIFFSYFLGFVFTFYTHTPLKMIWVSLNLLYIVMWTVKNRVNASSILSFASFTAIASFLFSTFFVVISTVLESNPTSFFPLHRLTECGVTFLASIPLYFVFNFVDDLITTKETWNEGQKQNPDEVL